MTDFDLDSAVISDVDEDDAPPPSRTRKPRSDKGKPRGTRGTRASSARKVADDLLVPWATIAAGVAMTAPTLSAVMLMRGEKTMDSVVSLASGHPRMMQALQKASKAGPAAELVQTGFMMVLAAGLDFGRIPPEHPMAIATGLTDVYAQTHQPVEENPVNGYPMPPGMSGMGQASPFPANMVPFPGMG